MTQSISDLRVNLESLKAEAKAARGAFAAGAAKFGDVEKIDAKVREASARIEGLEELERERLEAERAARLAKLREDAERAIAEHVAHDALAEAARFVAAAHDALAEADRRVVEVAARRASARQIIINAINAGALPRERAPFETGEAAPGVYVPRNVAVGDAIERDEVRKRGRSLAKAPAAEHNAHRGLFAAHFGMR
jgi:hypothetical protein